MDCRDEHCQNAAEETTRKTAKSLRPLRQHLNPTRHRLDGNSSSRFISTMMSTIGNAIAATMTAGGSSTCAYHGPEGSGCSFSGDPGVRKPDPQSGHRSSFPASDSAEFKATLHFGHSKCV